MRLNCDSGGCSVECGGGKGCGCWSDPDNPNDCDCKCYGKNSITGFGGVNIAFKRWKPKNKPTPQTRYNICIKGFPITGLAELLDKFLPNKILVPANRLNKKVTLSLRNNTLRQIINRSGLVLSIPAEGPKSKKNRKILQSLS